jgi:hypothetical protein
MSDLPPKVREYYALNPTAYFIVRLVSLSQGISPARVNEQSLYVVLGRELGGSSPCLHIEFQGVRKLVLQQPEWSQISLGHLEITQITADPAVTEKYAVRDAGQDSLISFECRDFDAVIS